MAGNREEGSMREGKKEGEKEGNREGERVYTLEWKRLPSACTVVYPCFNSSIFPLKNRRHGGREGETSLNDAHLPVMLCSN